jgi:catechol 2,3-dioxygenase-like lactoylglutathione lyase family enzyme
MTTIDAVARFCLTTGDASRLGAFYERALGFRLIKDEHLAGASFEQLHGVVGGARSLRLAIGEEVVELLEFASPGRPYPRGAVASDVVFQHLAVVVDDMDVAYRRLAAIGGWSAITDGGPQRLPATSGGVTAFKFRDPDGHPLELLGFAEAATPPRWRARGGAEPCLGIDHSAISVTDSARSIAFYEKLGFAIAARSLNRGAEQSRLDGLVSPVVEVTALTPREETPHVELLRYRNVARGAPAPANNDVAATRLVFAAAARSAGEIDEIPRAILDPDGHRLLIVAPSDPRRDD